MWYFERLTLFCSWKVTVRAERCGSEAQQELWGEPPKCHQLTHAETSPHVTLNLLYLHSFSMWVEHQPVSCLIRQKGGGRVNGRKKARKECQRHQWLCCWYWCCTDASSFSRALSSRSIVEVYSYISKQEQIYTRPMPKGPLENLSKWITFCSERKKY